MHRAAATMPERPDAVPRIELAQHDCPVAGIAAALFLELLAWVAPRVPFNVPHHVKVALRASAV
eukprot:4174490-Pleurochrysis_carterae.AAC.1